MCGFKCLTVTVLLIGVMFGIIIQIGGRFGWRAGVVRVLDKIDPTLPSTPTCQMTPAVKSKLNKFNEMGKLTLKLFGNVEAGFYQEIDVKLAGRDVRVLWARSRKTETPAPAVVYFHGGGWVLGRGEEMELDFLRKAHQQLESAPAVFSVDYRLAPQHKFPAGLNDCVEVVEFLASHAAQFGIDPERILLGGESAGGNLAVAAALRLIKNGHVHPKAMWVSAPVTDYATLFGGTSSAVDFGTNHLLTVDNMRFFYDCYCDLEDCKNNPEISVLGADFSSSFPSSLIQVNEGDVLRDEGRALAKKMKDAGVQVTITEAPNTFHAAAIGAGLFFPDANQQLQTEALQFFDSQLSKLN